MRIPEEVSSDGHGSAREFALDQIRHWIVEGVLAPGKIIKEREMAEALGVSRTPVREALLILKREGLVESEPQGWTQVKPLDTAQLAKIYPVMVDLEVLAARLAAANPERELTEVEAAHQAFADLIARSSDPPAADTAIELMRADDRFHRAIIQMADNVFLADALLPLKALMRRYEVLYYGRTTAIGRRSLDHHEQMLAAVRSGDADMAAEISYRNWQNFRWRSDEGDRR